MTVHAQKMLFYQVFYRLVNKFKNTLSILKNTDTKNTDKMHSNDKTMNRTYVKLFDGLLAKTDLYFKNICLLELPALKI